MRWQIEPLVGLGPLKLGMSRRQIGAILDPMHPVENFDDAYGGGKREFRGLEMPVVSYVGSEAAGFVATGFDTDWRVKAVALDTFDVYDHPSRDVLQFLEHKNGGGALAGLGFVLFPKLGINTNGFYDEKAQSFFDVRGGDQDERGLAVLRQGDADIMRAEFRPISFGE